MNEEQQKVSHIDYSSVPEGKLKESETPKPSKDMMDMIKEHTDRTCDMVIQKCIEVVMSEHVVFDYFDTDALIEKIIERLQNMKSK